MRRGRARLAAAVAFLGGALAGCAELQPFDPPVAGEMKPGPGLFSGPDGAFVISRPQRREPSTELPATPTPDLPQPRDLTKPPRP